MSDGCGRREKALTRGPGRSVREKRERDAGRYGPGWAVPGKRKKKEGRASWAAGPAGWAGLGSFLLLFISFLFYFKPNSNQIEFK